MTNERFDHLIDNMNGIRITIFLCVTSYVFLHIISDSILILSREEISLTGVMGLIWLALLLVGLTADSVEARVGLVESFDTCRTQFAALQ